MTYLGDAQRDRFLGETQEEANEDSAAERAAERMAWSVWKYPVPFEDTFSLNMPVGAQVLCVQQQHGGPQLWALVDTEAPKEPTWFRLVGTGQPVNHHVGRYIATIQTGGGVLVFHLFQMDDPEEEGS